MARSRALFVSDGQVRLLSDMATREFHRELVLNRPLEEVFAWHSRQGAFDRLTPPWQEIQVLRKQGSIQNGDEVEFSVAMGPLKTRWLARHEDYSLNKTFTDVQIHGPFKSWKHQHRFESISKTESKLIDHIEYELPLGGLVGQCYTESQLERLFDYRHATLAEDLRQHSLSGLGPQKILVSGASGLVGQALCAFLETGGHEIYSLVRRAPKSKFEIFWAPERNDLNAQSLEGLDAVINLSGENIAAGRWTDKVKDALRSSRLQTTSLLAQKISGLQKKPHVFVSASAIGYYGNRNQELLKESEPASQEFLGQLCQDWENATKIARDSGIRVVTPRIGIVLTPAGGALQKMLTPFKLGIGGPLGTGDQYMSWISLDDLLYVFLHCIAKTELSGAVNATTPQALTNLEFSKVLATALHRPLGPKVPAFVLRTLTGEMADALLLASTRCEPSALNQTSFSFSRPELASALEHLLGRHD